MRQNFRANIFFDGKTLTAVILPEHRKDGIYYEVNIIGYPRFYMSWSASDRYDITNPNTKIPNNLSLAVSDAIEEYTNNH